MRTRVQSVRLIVLACCLSMFSSTSFSQSLSAGNGKIEIGLGLGPSFFLGDLGGNHGYGSRFIKDVNLPVTKLMKGVYANFYPTEWFGLRVAVNLGELEGYDSLVSSNDKNALERKKRNLGFKSNLSEVYVAAEIYPTILFEHDDDALDHKFRPYGLIGIGMFHFNPKAQYIEPNGQKEWVDLQPLHLEGQGFPEYPDRKNYSLTQREVLMGGGFKFYLTGSMYIGFEILHRKTFTDYIDDVSTTYIDPHLFDLHLSASQATIAKQMAYREKFYNPSVNRPYINYQRGDPKQNDAYFSGLLRFGMRLNGANENKRELKHLRCPVFY